MKTISALASICASDPRLAHMTYPEAWAISRSIYPMSLILRDTSPSKWKVICNAMKASGMASVGWVDGLCRLDESRDYLMNVLPKSMCELVSSLSRPIDVVCVVLAWASSMRAIDPKKELAACEFLRKELDCHVSIA